MRQRRRVELGIRGVLRGRLVLPYRDVARAIIRGVDGLATSRPWRGAWRGGEEELALVRFSRPNAFVNQGLQIVLDRAYGISGPPSAISHIGVTSDSTAVTAATTTLDDGATGDLSIKPFSPAASRTAQTVDAGATFTESDVTFVMRKIGLLNSAADGNLVDAIGGGGVAPYDDAFTLDLTSTSSFSLDLGIQVTLTAT